MDENIPETSEADVKAVDSPPNATDKGCCVALVVCVVMDVIAACGISSLVFASMMKLWIALVLGIPVGLVVVSVIYSVIGSQDGVDMVVTHAIMCVLALILFPVFSQARKTARKTTCILNEKTLVVAVLQYAQDWDDKLPAADHWADFARPLIIKRDKTSRPFNCPEANSPFSYAFSSSLSGVTCPDGARGAQTVMLFEADAKVVNANGGGELLARPGRHFDMDVFAYSDGHVKAYKPGSVDLARSEKSGDNQKR